jgi:glutamate racemase
MNMKPTEKPTENRPMGIFDSGVGGLCVFREIKKRLPHESIHYFADSRNCPYGSKTKENALSLSRKNIEFLLKQDCKLIVIACNTVTAVAIDNFRSEYKIPFVGMEPALKPAALQSKTKKIGILATENTLNSKLFKQTFEKYATGLEVFVQPGYGLVELVEQNAQKSDHARRILTRYLLPMMDKGVDTLVLGCTHYPFLIETIKQVTKNRITIIDPADAVANQTKRLLIQFDLASNKNHHPLFHFFTTGDKEIAQTFIDHAIKAPYTLEQVNI